MKVSLLAYTQLNHLWPYHCVDDKLMADKAGATGSEPERLVEYAARVCTRSTEKLGSDPAFIQERIAENHESVIEHVSFSFLIEGISRSCSHQIVRHRIASFSQESQRYCDGPRGNYEVADLVHPRTVEVVPPDIWADYRNAMAALLLQYGRLRRAGVPKEDTRYLLPNATPTRLVVTMNARSLRHFLKLRLAPAAQWEIRAVAREMLKLVRQVAPRLFEDMEVADGT